MIRWIAAVALAMLAPVPALAQANAPTPDRIIDIAQPDVVEQALKDEGYKATLNVPLDGQPYIEVSSDDAPFRVIFSGCKVGRNCDALEFYSWYEKNPAFTADVANRWNSTQRFVSLFVDDDGSLVLEMYVSTVGKTTYANFADEMHRWSDLASDVDGFLYEAQKNVIKSAADAAKKR